jgi:hypothetical protein
LFFQPFDFEHTWWRLLHKHVMCTKFDIYDFIKERKNLTCNHPPVNFVNAIYQCYLNQIICLCTINIGSALLNSVFSNTIIFYSNVCYINDERPSSSQNVHWLYISFLLACRCARHGVTAYMQLRLCLGTPVSSTNKTDRHHKRYV